tara:strand:- start:46 stop:231 length:186 start_codon:yes stop_codon:yes gene_type:complete
MNKNILTFAKREIFGCSECGSIDFHIEAEQSMDDHKITQLICSNSDCRTVYEMNDEVVEAN